MNIKLENIGLFYENHCLFDNLNITFNKNKTYVCLGENGSGKSSLLKLLCGYLPPTTGKLKFYSDIESNPYNNNKIFNLISLVSPYNKLFDELSIIETIEFIKIFKPFKPNSNFKQIFIDAKLNDSLNKPIFKLSSGQQQRVKLITSLLADTEILLLDEPTAHLDAQGIEWYSNLLKNNVNNRTVIIASNNNENDFPVVSQKFQLLNCGLVLA